MATFDTVEDFWALMNYVSEANNLPVGSDYSLFKVQQNQTRVNSIKSLYVLDGSLLVYVFHFSFFAGRYLSRLGGSKKCTWWTLDGEFSFHYVCLFLCLFTGSLGG